MSEDLNPLRGGTLTVPTAAGGALIAVEQQRAIAEVQARMLIARANPRDPIRCMDLILSDCERMTVAEHAVYQYAKGGTDITGPSIKLIEGVARRWGNVASGIKELSRANGASECMAYALDMETGYYDERTFQVRHWRDTKGGGYPIKDEREIYELIANMGQRRKRAVLETVLPDDVIDAAVKACERTLKAKADTSAEGVGRMLEAFTEFKVSRAQIELRIQRRLDAVTPANVVSLKKIYASLRDGMSTAADWFDPDPAQAPNASGGEGGNPEAPQSATQRAKDALKRRAGGKGAPEPETPPGAPAGPAAAPAVKVVSQGAVDEAHSDLTPRTDDAAKTTVDLPFTPEEFVKQRAAEHDAGPTAEALRSALMAAADKDAAMLVIDRARHLPKADYESLTALLDQRFPDDQP